jgi:hypothetical protein
MVSTFLPPPDSAATADEAEASLALLESFRALKSSVFLPLLIPSLVTNEHGLHSSPSTLESLTRLSTSQWVVHRRNVDSSSPFHSSAPSATTHPMDIYGVLPAKTSRGKDASLLDAAEELRKVGRAYLA